MRQSMGTGVRSLYWSRPHVSQHRFLGCEETRLSPAQRSGRLVMQLKSSSISGATFMFLKSSGLYLSHALRSKERRGDRILRFSMVSNQSMVDPCYLLPAGRLKPDHWPSIHPCCSVIQTTYMPSKKSMVQFWMGSRIRSLSDGFVIALSWFIHQRMVDLPRTCHQEMWTSLLGVVSHMPVLVDDWV